MKKRYITNLVIPIAILLGLAINAGAQTTFSYTGSVQTYVTGPGVTSIAVDMYGGGGGGAYNCCTSQPHAPGGRVQCVLAVSPSTTYYIYVGGVGGSYGSSTVGGFNGGANSGGTFCAAGGGASDIRTASGVLTSRLVVAGGGGGGGDFNATGGLGGGLTGGNGQIYSTYQALGGTQTAGGTNTVGSTSYSGSFGNGGSAGGSSGGGGGGWYGGAGGYLDGGGAGGSSYTDPTLATSVVHTQGYSPATNNGQVIITPLSPTVTATPAAITFLPTLVGTTAFPAQYTSLSGAYMTSATLSMSLSGSGASAFQIETDATATTTGWASTATSTITIPTFSGINVYVNFTPSAAITYNATLTITGGGLATP
jgi:hypothetical protein